MALSRRELKRFPLKTHWLRTAAAALPLICIHSAFALDAASAPPAPAPAPAAAPAPPFRDLDALLTDLSAELERYRLIARTDDAPSPSAASTDAVKIAACRQSVPLPDMIKDLEANLRYLTLSPKLFDIYGTMLHYQLCVSETSGESSCGELRMFARPTGMAHDTGFRLDRTCEHAFRADALVRSALLRAPDAHARCEEALTAAAVDEPELIDLGASDRFCALFLENWDDPKAACARMFSRSVYMERGKHWTKNCEPALRALIGDEAFCGRLAVANHGIDTATDAESCRDYAALRKASRAGDPRLCGASQFCLRAMGQPSSCAGAADKIEDWYCGRFKILVGNVDRVNALFKRAAEALDAAGPHDAPEWRERSEKLRGLVRLGVALLPKYGVGSDPVRWSKDDSPSY